jgi:hypothetical protein
MELLSSVIPPHHSTGLNMIERIHQHSFTEGLPSTDQILAEERIRFQLRQKLTKHQDQMFDEAATTEEVKVFKNFLSLANLMCDATKVFTSSIQTSLFEEVDSLYASSKNSHLDHREKKEKPKPVP